MEVRSLIVVVAVFPLPILFDEEHESRVLFNTAARRLMREVLNAITDVGLI